MPPRPFQTDDLTGSVKVFAERLEPRLAAGAKTFQSMRLIVAALAPLVVASFLFGVYNSTFAKKAAIDALGEAEMARHSDLERRTAVLEAQRTSDALASTKALTDITAQLREQANVLLDIRIRLGAVPTTPEPTKRGNR